jgi:hypothetical protein
MPDARGVTFNMALPSELIQQVSPVRPLVNLPYLIEPGLTHRLQILESLFEYQRVYETSYAFFLNYDYEKKSHYPDAWTFCDWSIVQRPTHEQGIECLMVPDTATFISRLTNVRLVSRQWKMYADRLLGRLVWWPVKIGSASSLDRAITCRAHKLDSVSPTLTRKLAITCGKRMLMFDRQYSWRHDEYVSRMRFSK